tara:strand:- start:1774 stop:1956 length:183 start_codon:yes stop_codon:yes gene_type:complete
MSNPELEKLKEQHARLHNAIEKMLDTEQVNDNKLTVMKKHKLWLKDKITNIETTNQLQNA